MTSKRVTRSKKRRKARARVARSCLPLAMIDLARMTARPFQQAIGLDEEGTTDGALREPDPEPPCCSHLLLRVLSVDTMVINGHNTLWTELDALHCFFRHCLAFWLSNWSPSTLPSSPCPQARAICSQTPHNKHGKRKTVSTHADKHPHRNIPLHLRLRRAHLFNHQWHQKKSD